MKRESAELTNQIEVVIRDITRKDILEQVYNKAIKEDGLYLYFTPMRIRQILQNSVPIHTLSENNLYNISLFLVKNGLLEINLDEYFTEEAMKVATSDKRQTEEKYVNGVLFNNVLFNGNEYAEEYITMLSYKEIAEMYDSGVFHYNFATQRKAKIIKIKGRTERIADVNMESVKQICEKIKENSFHMNAITLNIRVTGKEIINYNETNRTLSINKEAEIDEIDGYHRTKAISMAYKENPRIEGKMVVIIKHLTVAKARDYISQEALGNVHSQEYMRLYDSSGAVAQMIDLINRNNRNGNILKNKISIGESREEALIFDGVFAKNLDAAWSDIFNGATTYDLNEISNFICDFYNVAYDLICRKLKVKTIEELKGTVALDMMFMSGFLFPAATMYIDNDKQIDNNGMKKIIDKIDLETVDGNKYSYVDDNKYQYNPYKKAWENL